jgi:signal transduction histidine kinase
MRHTSSEAILENHAPLHLLLTVAIRSEIDVIASRLRARQITALCGFGNHEQTRIATAVSELARNACIHASRGSVRFFIGELDGRQAFVVAVDDQGRGSPEDAGRLGGDGRILAVRRLMDSCQIGVGAAGTQIVVAQAFPAQEMELDLGAIDMAMSQLAALPSAVALSDAHHQNNELSDALAALQAKQDELLAVTACLERTNEQVEALNVRLNEKASALVSADRRKDEFLSILSHELRGPLSAVAMAAQLLEKGRDYGVDQGSQGVKLGQLITRQSGHMSRLVEDLLDVSRVSRGLVSLNRTAIDMRDVVGAAVEQHAPAASAKGHAVVQHVPCTPCIVDGDRTRLIQIVANLLGNAIRYTSDGGRIDVSLHLDAHWLLVRVADNGIGIAPGAMAHLFDLYTQAERSSDARNSGLGLGLALVKSLVEAHGGSVEGRSAGAGLGSTFDVRLKLFASG